MTGIVWQANITDLQGNVIPAANVEVRNQLTGALVTLYRDFALTDPWGLNPIQSDGFGFVKFFVALPGLYQITASKGGFSRQWTHVALTGVVFAPATAIVTPPALVAGNNNNWNAQIGLVQDGIIVRVRFSGNAGGSVITGMQGGTDGRRAYLTNVGANDASALSQSALSTAANRLAMNGDLFWPPGVSHEFIYESAISRWSKVGN